MKIILIALSLLLLASCGDEKVYTPDYKSDIDSNAKRIELLETNDALQDLRLDALEVTVSDLESRVSDNEDAIDANESDIADLFDLVEDLDDELDSLRNNLRYQIYRLHQADRQTRRLIRSEVRSLRRSLAREIRNRRLADYSLQNQIDGLESELNQFEASQSVINSFLAGGLALTNLRISQLQSYVNYSINRLDNRIDDVEIDINSINQSITNMQTNISDIEDELLLIGESVASVVYPCGEGNSEEVLLQTQDGLLAYFQQTQTVTESFNIGQTIPEHFICDRFAGSTDVCIRGHNVATSTASQNITVTHQVLKKAYLDILGDGSYRTTDGYSCNFSIVNGEVQ